jgi:hypothetical protein
MKKNKEYTYKQAFWQYKQQLLDRQKKRGKKTDCINNSADANMTQM